MKAPATAESSFTSFPIWISSRARNKILVLWFPLLLTVLSTWTGKAQPALTSGAYHDGTISPAGNVDVWSFTASSGERILLSIALLSGTFDFEAFAELRGPDGTPLTNAFAGGYAGDADQLTWTATSSGTFTVRVYDVDFVNDGTNGTGSYRLSFVKVPGTSVVPAGDEGGSLTNGGNHSGTITLGDLDVWTFTANTGDNIALSIAMQTGINSFTPVMRLYPPDGSTNFGSLTIFGGEVTQSGTWTVVVSDGLWSNDGYAGTGTYILYFAKTPGAFVVPEGDDGGSMTNGGSYSGTILFRDIDPWSFTACAGNNITLEVTALSSTNGFTPWIRLYGEDGTLLGNASDSPSATISGLVTKTGAYRLLVADGNFLLNGKGAYRLDVAGIFGPVSLNSPAISSTNVVINGTGQGTNCTCVLLVSTNVTVLVNLWTPIQTNNFGSAGQFSFTNLLDPALPERYFLLGVP